MPPDPSIDSLRAKSSLSPTDHYQLGNLLRRAGHLEESITHLAAAARLQPRSPEIHNDLGVALLEVGRAQSAVSAFQTALKLHPLSPLICNNLGNALKHCRHLDLAAAAYQQSIHLAPADPQTLTNLGSIFQEKGDLHRAIQTFHQAIKLSPNFAPAHCNLGTALLELAEIQHALASSRRAVELDPTSSIAHFNLGFALLLTGDFANGWSHFDHRLSAPELNLRRQFPIPRWTGQPLPGRRILLHAEQGLGDTIQFIRYANLIAPQGATVILECRPELHRLLRTAPGITQIISPGDSFAADFHSPLLSLPMILGTTLHNIPAQIPYLFADHPPQQKLPAPTHHIGLAWAGNPNHRRDHHRSIPLSEFNLLTGLPHLHFHTLQTGEAASQITTANFPITNHTADLLDLSDTAALICSLDLVITVDTVIAHLAAALGKPVWMLTPFAPDWRWLLDRSDTPWYPTLRLFRQQKPMSWQQPLHNIRQALATLPSPL